jgi:hypothetical protein
MFRTSLTLIALVAVATIPGFAADTTPDHQHESHAATLQLDAGKKWGTDAPLRKWMTDIRHSMSGRLPDIHEGRLPLDGYVALASKVEGAVLGIIAECKLPPAADEQLHIIVADMMAGVRQMSDSADATVARSGAIRVIGALGNYARYFDDPTFKPLEH